MRAPPLHACIPILTLALALACAAPERTHVVLVSVDTLRADRLGLYGNAQGTTPRLDGFFAAGSVFENAVSPSPCTLPAVPQILAGAHLVGRDRPTLAELLARHGYATHAIASQHQFGPTRPRPDLHREAVAQVRRGFETFDLQGPEAADRHGLSTRDAAEVSTRALRWLASRQDDARPFFLWLHYFDPHDPYEPPPAHRPDAAGDADGDRRQRLMDGRRSPSERWQGAGYVFDAEDVAQLRALYDGEVRFTDAEIGRVLDGLARLRLVERSLVVLLADHGEWLGEEGRWDHCLTLRQEELHVPLLVRDRGRPLLGRSRVAAPVSTLDVVPTVLARLGIDAGAAAFDGAPLLPGGAGRPIFATWMHRVAVYRGRWKLHHGSAPIALLNVRRDRDERHDLLGRGLAIEAVLRADLRAFLRGRGDALARQSAHLEGRLRALGYLE